MKVSKVKSGSSTSSASRKKVGQGHGAEFAEHLKGAVTSSETSGLSDAGSVGAVDSILAVQETGDATQGKGRRQSLQYAGDLLDHLEDLRRDLILGAIGKDKLSGLAQKMRAHRRQTDDPKLNEIIDEIELRAEVEIAKLTR